MSNEILKRDQNSVPVLAGITDDASQEIRMLRVDPTSSRLLVSATGVITGSGAANQVTFWTSASNISGDSNFTYDSASGKAKLGTPLFTPAGALPILTVWSNISGGNNNAFGVLSNNSNADGGVIIKPSMITQYPSTAEDIGGIQGTNSNLNAVANLAIQGEGGLLYVGAMLNDGSGSRLQVTGGIHNTSTTTALSNAISTSSGSTLSEMYSDGFNGGFHFTNGSNAGWSFGTSGTDAGVYNESLASYTMNFGASANMVQFSGQVSIDSGLTGVIDSRARLQILGGSGDGIFLVPNDGLEDTPNLVFKPTTGREVSMDGFNSFYRFISEANGGGSGYAMLMINGSGTALPTTTAALGFPNANGLAIASGIGTQATYSDTADLVFYAGLAETGRFLGSNQSLELQKKVSKYNAVSTTGYGLPAIYGYARAATGRTAAVTSVAIYTPTSDGSFIVSANVLVTTSTLHNFTVTCSYTDEGNTSRTVTMPFSVLAGTFVTAITNASGAVPYEGLPIHIRVKANTAITVATTGTFTTVTYNVEGCIEQIA